MQEKFFKTAKNLFLLAFVVFAAFISLKTTTFAATSKVTNVEQFGAAETSISVRWAAVSGASGYTIYVSELSTFPANATITKSTWFANERIDNLEPNRTYYVKVRAKGSDTFSDTVACVTDPQKVVGLTHSSSTTSSLTVSWKAPASGADYYNVYYFPVAFPSQKIFAGSTAGTTYTIGNLIDDTSYHIYVCPAKKSASGYEASGFLYDLSMLNTVAKANRLSQIKLYRWDAGSAAATVSFTNSSKVQSGVQIEIRSLTGKKIKTFTAAKNAASISFSLNSIKNKGFKYRLRTYVTVNGKNCYGPYTSQKIAIARPKVTAAKKSNTSLKLSWKKISGAKSYSVYLAKGKNYKFKKVATVKSTSYTLKQTRYSTDYYVYVQANGVKSGKKKYSSTKAVWQSITQVYYRKNSKVTNYYTSYSK